MKDSTCLPYSHTLELSVCAYTKAQLPDFPEPQIALAGRSNVGKSSLINALAGRKKLAKISATPGKTRSINFYKVTPGDYYLVDLPGYGYARASHGDRQSWAAVLEYYISQCKALKALALLLDCRLPAQKLDLGLIQYAQNHGILIQPILTKGDKCTQKQKKEKVEEWQVILGIKPIVVSSQKKQGIEKLWLAFDQIALGNSENSNI